MFIQKKIIDGHLVERHMGEGHTVVEGHMVEGGTWWRNTC